MGFIITLILVGLVLIFAEVLLVPGVGIAGILGLLSLAGSCFCAFTQIGTTTGVIVTAVNVVETSASCLPTFLCVLPQMQWLWEFAAKAVVGIITAIIITAVTKAQILFSIILTPLYK